MDTLLSWVISCGLIINVIFSFREGMDERGRKIMFFPLLISFSLLFVGYSILNVITNFWILETATFKLCLGFLFAAVLLVYLVYLFIERRRLS